MINPASIINQISKSIADLVDEIKGSWGESPKYQRKLTSVYNLEAAEDYHRSTGLDVSKEIKTALELEVLAEVTQEILLGLRKKGKTVSTYDRATVNGVPGY